MISNVTKNDVSYTPLSTSPISDGKIAGKKLLINPENKQLTRSPGKLAISFPEDSLPTGSPSPNAVTCLDLKGRLKRPSVTRSMISFQELAW